MGFPASAGENIDFGVCFEIEKCDEKEILAFGLEWC
jgi:hypothetical protein